ncbi:uncharacterized protein J7T54_003047 [Emericellopsis cladophorae]|uniref:Peptidase M43 pregnancy-associated plasma-A domain-containing protein n=1 Tax=Emericellopsis cladophorae TaxID=2686198 RepID=A0A9P9XYK5_9HYPO|nr:uncharacterized protein J7T54_003047 [Emericellopsis cladophorae]KAI6780268.1 hypothetical protein J7T54_003047 [Emericellopsis cladophorae]
MKPSLARGAILFALSGASIVLGQDFSSSSSVDQIPQTITDSVPEVSTSLLDVSVTEPLEGEPGETEPADPEMTASELTDSSSKVEIDTETMETTLATSSEISPIESSATSTEAAETPSSTDEIGDENEITLVTDPSLLKNSTEQFVPVEITPENYLAEEAVNKPITELSEEDAKEIAILEGSLFNDFVESAPAPVDDGMLSIPLNTSECDVNLEKRIWPFKDYKDVRQCIPIRSLEFDVHYNFILPTTYGSVPPDLWRRVGVNHGVLMDVFGPLGITLTIRTAQNWWPPTNGSNSNWTTVKQDEERLRRWQRQSHKGGKMALNIWMVPGLADFEVNGVSMSLFGYATFPRDIAQKGKTDGIVLREDLMDNFVQGTRRGSTLIHEVGHWLGIYHTFGRVVSDAAEDCKYDDGLLKSTHTRGHEDSVFECVQIPCASEKRFSIYNWMSYSDCPGGPGATRGFTTDQKAAMFARSIYWRRGIRNAECNPSDPGGSVSKRSTMQDLVDGKCPDVDQAVEEIQNYDQEVTDESLADPEMGDEDSNDGARADDEDDTAAHIRLMSSLGLGITVTAALFMLM